MRSVDGPAGGTSSEADISVCQVRFGVLGGPLDRLTCLEAAGSMAVDVGAGRPLLLAELGAGAR